MNVYVGLETVCVDYFFKKLREKGRKGLSLERGIRLSEGFLYMKGPKSLFFFVFVYSLYLLKYH